MKSYFNIFNKIGALLCAILFFTLPVNAQNISSADFNYVFSKIDVIGANHKDQPSALFETLSKTEMEKTQGAKFRGAVHVYGLMNGRPSYIGISNNVPGRTGKHIQTKPSFTHAQILYTAPNRTEARIMEQNLINHYNTKNNGWNKINSISPSNPLSSQVSVPYRPAIGPHLPASSLPPRIPHRPIGSIGSIGSNVDRYNPISTYVPPSMPTTISYQRPLSSSNLLMMRPWPVPGHSPIISGSRIP